MQRSNLVIKIVSAILFIAMLAYIGFSLVERYTSGSAGQRSVLAVEQTVNESCSGEGLMFREEQVITGGGALCRVTAADGSKVGVGQPVAALYADENALEASREVESLVQQQQRLETLLSYEQAGQDADQAGSVVGDGLLRLSAALNSGMPEDLDLICDEVRAMVVVSVGESYSQRLQEVQLQMESLRSQASGAVSLIYAPAAGLFSDSCDGLESLNPLILGNLRVDELEQLLSQTGNLTGNEAGKLVTGLRWYFAMTIPEEYAQKTYDGDRSLRLHFPRLLEQDIQVRVERVGAVQNGKCLIVLSSDRELAALADVRQATGELIFSSLSGIRVPREAARVDENGQVYVYTLVGIQAQRKNMEIIAETDSYYLVDYNSTDENSLRVGNEILVNYSGLYEGKVIG